MAVWHFRWNSGGKIWYLLTCMDKSILHFTSCLLTNESKRNKTHEHQTSAKLGINWQY